MLSKIQEESQKQKALDYLKQVINKDVPPTKRRRQSEEAGPSNNQDRPRRRNNNQRPNQRNNRGPRNQRYNNPTESEEDLLQLIRVMKSQRRRR